MAATITEVFFSFLPVLLLMALPLLSNMRIASLVTFVVTSIIYFAWGTPISYYGATLFASLVATVNILMIVFGAVFLFEMMNASGYIQQISQSVSNVHPLKEVRFFLIAIGLTGFFEGVAGFGTPGAIVPLLLISMGFNPVLSVAVVLLFDGLFALFGAVGTPLIAGLSIPLALTESQTFETAVYASGILLVASPVLMWFIIRMYTHYESSIEAPGKVWMMLMAAMVPLFGFAFVLPEYSTILASLTMLVLSVMFISGNPRSLEIKAWLPYLSLVLLLLIPKIAAPVNQLLDWEIRWDAFLETTINASIKPLKSPLIPCLLVAIIFTKSRKHLGTSFSTAGNKLVSVALLLFPIICVAQLMLSSGYARSSMINIMAQTFTQAGQGYVILSPLIGITGAFITGSTTLSNMVFGYSQQQTAVLLSIDSSIILALQLVGASIGNAVCLFNIIAACSVANIKQPNEVLLKNLLPTLVVWLTIGAAGLVFIILFG